MRRKAVWTTLALVLGAAAVWTMVSRDTGIAVTTASVTRVESLTAVVTASGEIVAARYADIGSPIMGRLVSLNADEGDAVRAGTVLAQIDPVQAEASAAAAEAGLSALEADARAALIQVRAGEAALDETRARAEEAGTAFTRASQLRDAGLLAAADFDRAKSAADAAQAQHAAAAAAADRQRQDAGAAEHRVAQARAERTRARDQVTKTAITAPIDGVVTRLDVEVGEMVVVGVQNQPGTILMTVSDLAAIDAEVKVAEADVMRLSAGMPARVTLEAVPGRRIDGRVVEIGASALSQLGTTAAAREFRVTVRLEADATSLRPGLTCDAEIEVARRRGVLAVPLQAVVERGGRTGVFERDGGRARFVPVTTGIIGGLQIEVEGLREGAEIVVGPLHVLRSLEDGIGLRVQK